MSTTPPLPDIDGERALWAAVIEEAVENAQGRGFSLGRWEIADARQFLRTIHALEWMAPIWKGLGIDPVWFQEHLRRQYPEIFIEPARDEIALEPPPVAPRVEVQ